MLKTHVLATVVAMRAGVQWAARPWTAARRRQEHARSDQGEQDHHPGLSPVLGAVLRAGPDGKPAGYSIDLCTGVADDLRKRSGDARPAVKWVPVTVEDRIAAVRNGTIDLECGSTTNTLSRQDRGGFQPHDVRDGRQPAGDAARPQDAHRFEGAAHRGHPGHDHRAGAEGRGQGRARSGELIPVKDHAEGRSAIENKTADAYASDRDILIGLAPDRQEPVQLRPRRPLLLVRALRADAAPRRRGVPAGGESLPGPTLPLRRSARDLPALVRRARIADHTAAGDLRHRGPPE